MKLFPTTPTPRRTVRTDDSVRAGMDVGAHVAAVLRHRLRPRPLAGHDAVVHDRASSCSRRSAFFVSFKYRYTAQHGAARGRARRADARRRTRRGRVPRDRHETTAVTDVVHDPARRPGARGRRLDGHDQARPDRRPGAHRHLRRDLGRRRRLVGRLRHRHRPRQLRPRRGDHRHGRPHLARPDDGRRRCSAT